MKTYSHVQYPDELTQSTTEDKPYGMNATKTYSFNDSITSVDTADATIVNPNGSSSSIDSGDITITGLRVIVILRQAKVPSAGEYRLKIRGHSNSTIVDAAVVLVINVVA